MGHVGDTLSGVIPAAHNERFARVFRWYNRRLLGKAFHGIRIAPGTAETAARLDAETRPVVLVLNHASWWDPLVALTFGNALIPSRRGIAPMDSAQLRKFRFFRKLGVFGIDPHDSGSFGAMSDYVLGWFSTAAKPTLAITAQGRFTDVREPVRIRPGAAAIAAKLGPGGCVCASLAIEYAFWQDQRPEVFLRVRIVDEPPTCTTASWHRAIESVMQQNADELARLVIARDSAAFRPLLTTLTARVNPLYDLILRTRGQSAEISTRQNEPPVVGRSTHTANGGAS